MSALDDLMNIAEDPLNSVLDAGIYVEPKDRSPLSEDDRQMALVALIRRCAPRIAIHATPNDGKRTDWMKIRGQKMGMYAGWPDLTFDWADGGAHIEMKDGQGKAFPKQIDCLNRLHRMGKHVAVCRTQDGALRWLRSVGAPVPEIRA